jgi:membrane protease YdiL (CAAX protease family)
MRRTNLSIHEAAVVSAICFGLFIVWSTQAVLSGFPEARYSDSGDAWMVLVEAVLAASALLYLRARNFDVWSLYPQPDLRGTLFGLGLFVAAWLAGVIATAPFMSPGGPSQVTEFSFSGVSIASTVLFAMANGAFEEVFLLGVLVRGLRAYGLSIAIGVPLLVRLLYHLYQGPLGAVWVLAFGLTFTLFYIRNSRLWPAVFAHTLWDIVPVVLAGG